MWRLIFLYICISASANNDVEIFRKCCPEGQNLLKVMNLDFISLENTYECLDSVFENTFNISNPKPTLFVAESVAVEYRMPEDCDLKIIQFEGNDIQLSPSSNHCYDRLVMEVINGTAIPVIPKTIALVCNGSDVNNESNVKITNIRKCCPPGQSYDTEFHLCRSGDDGYGKKWLIKKLQAISGKVYEFDNELHCKSAEYAVELKEEQFSISLVGSTLNILNRSGKGGGLSPRGNWCVDREYSSQRLVARVCTKDCSTYDALCIRKCCPIGQHYLPFQCQTLASRCVPNTDDKVLFNITSYINRTKKRYGVGGITGLRTNIFCENGKIALNSSAPHDWHHLTREGTMESGLGITNDYCMEVFDTSFCGVDPYVATLVCYIEPPPIKNYRLSFVLNTLSAICLAMTLMVYCAIPELRNLHGKNLICHVSTMLIAYSCLARVQFDYVKDQNLCIFLGYGIYFGFLAAFAWLNVMCADIWLTFGSVRTVQPLHKGNASRRKFRWYSLYAWGLSGTLTLTMFLLDRYPVADVLDANMGHDVCWFGATQNSKSDWPHYIFFVIPMGLITCSNFTMWLLTARHCARVKSEVRRLQAGSVGDRAKRNFRVDRANFMLSGKLWVVMGAGWGSELIATLASGSMNWFWTIVDMTNELQGVFIFIILIFKPKLYYLIRKRLGFSRTSKDPSLENNGAQKNGPLSTARTSSTFLSRTISSDERTHALVSLPNDNAKQS